ncbi:MAG: hypothetical protein A2046_16610 [Bacteroidetes bacterium GWA2_30_7]|nr:MAG: hypothetical protein A2046_16610 [Bacteroidetes bacterium GWA2_30_7]
MNKVKLKKAVFTNFDRFEEKEFEIEFGEKITTLVGTNGSGKSSLLEALSISIAFFNLFTIEGEKQTIINHLNIKKSTNSNFEKVNLIFEVLDLKKDVDLNNDFNKHLIESKEIHLYINANSSSFLSLNKIIFFTKDSNIIDYEINHSVHDVLKDPDKTKEMNNREIYLQKKIQDLDINIKNNNNQIRSAILNIQQRNQLKSRNTELQTEKNAYINESKGIKLLKNSIYFENKPTTILRTDLEKFIQSLNIPKIIYIHQNDTLDGKIISLKSKLLESRNSKGSIKENSPFIKYTSELANFLKMDIETEGDKENFILLLDNLNLNQLSVGTYIALSFYALSFNYDENSIIVWDEPENSLHPTRRIKMLELMKQNPRKFIIATHSTEFAPVFDKNCNVYKMFSKFEYGFDKPKCKLQNAKNLLDAFDLTYSLGYEPSKLLFTANCIIWVEGPSDLIYLKFWINKYKEIHNIELIEGFDYTFMFSSGSLISHFDLEPNVDSTNEINNLVNILHITPGSIFIVDTDIDENQAVDFEKALEKNDNDNIFALLKERIKNIYKACEKVNKEGNECSKLIYTYGREIENYITPKSFKEILKYMFNIDKKSINEFKAIDNVNVGRWESFENSINKTIIESENKLIYLKDNIKQMKYLNKLSEKVPFANIYKRYYEENPKDFSFEKCLTDQGVFIKKIVEFIQNIKDKYCQ